LATKAGVTVTSSPVTLTVVNLTPPVSPNLTFNFDDGLVPAGTVAYSGAGGGYVTANGGVGDSGVFHITDSMNGESGAFVISNLYNGAQVSAIAAAWDVRLGGGTAPPADGYSFNFANNLTAGVSGGENGNGSGISVCFDIYGGLTDVPPAPNCNIRYKGALVASIQIPYPTLETGAGFATVLLRVDPDGKLYLSYGETVLYNGLQLPAYTFTSAGKFGFYGRTGGLNENQWIDNVLIKGTQSSGPLSVVGQPANATVLAGHTASFSVALSDPNGATYQWQRYGTNLPGATGSSYTTPVTTVADNGATFRVNANGPSGSATSSNALLSVIAPITIGTPQVIYDFNDCSVPVGTILNGSAGGGYVDCSGGVTNSGVLKLTDAIGGEAGTFFMPDLNAGAAVKGITAYFAARIADGSIPPADGFSFCWANDLPTGGTFGEDGGGSGLVVSFDTYDNGGGEAPAFNIVYNNIQVATNLVDISALVTGDYVDVFIRVNPDGTVDVQHNGNVIFNKVHLPGFTAMLGGAFAIGARTGGSYEAAWFDNIALSTTPGLIPVPLSFSVSGGNLRLAWAAGGFKLQSTPSLRPPAVWTDVPGATSPWVVPTSPGSLFYRLAPAP
jgi:hypothetical protein